MIEKMSNYILDNILYSGEEIDNDQKDIMLFGITRIIEDIPKFATIFFICFLLDILKEASIVLAVTVGYKIFIGGAHARTNIGCFIVSSIYFILPIMLAKYVNYSLNLFYIFTLFVIAFSAYVIAKIAPADTEEIPIINKDKRKRMKIYGSIALMIIMLLNILFVKDIVHMRIVVYTIFIINIFTTPIMYKFLKCKLGIDSEEYGKLYK